MRSKISFVAVAFLIFHSISTSQIQQLGGKGSHHTEVTLMANVKSIKPGVPFTVGVLMKMERGWHTYWKNSGEAGLPTQVGWTLPPGFVPGAIAWPVPEKHVEAGDVLTYGYSDETMLMVPCDVPAGAVPGTRVTLRAKVEWLECENICVPGSAEVELTLPVVASGAAADNADLFGKFRARLSRAFEDGHGISWAARTAGGAVTLALTATGAARFSASPDAAPDFYPEPLPDILIGRTIVLKGAGNPGLKIPLTASRPVTSALTLQGILLYTLDGEQRRAETVRIELPREFVTGLSSSGTPTPLLERTFSTVPSAGDTGPLWLYLVFALLGGMLVTKIGLAALSRCGGQLGFGVRAEVLERA